jgi:hypothetical protein
MDEFSNDLLSRIRLGESSEGSSAAMVVYNAPRRDLGVNSKEFADAMVEFASADIYMGIAVRLEIFAGGLDPGLSFTDCCLQFILDMKSKVNADGTQRYKVGACRRVASVFKKLGIFCHQVNW